jgi:hypothetical protein
MLTSWRAFLLIFLLHCGVQCFFLSKVPAQYVLPHTRWEISAVAMALYERGEFADPYCLPTGSTAHMPPFQPALMAAVYSLLGPTLLAAAGAWRTLPRLSSAQRAAILIPLAAYPLVYYIVGYEARYRQPLDGLILLLAAAAVLRGSQTADESRATIAQ